MTRRQPYEFTAPGPDAPVYWTSLDDLRAQDPTDPSVSATSQAELAAEFPSGAEAFTDPVSRRTFMTLMGASIALGTLQGCRRPETHLVPYTRMPEGVNIGTAAYYATAIERRGDAVGLLVESHEGRPTKIEGNPDHPGTGGGGTDLITQASILDLYDPDRARRPSDHNGNSRNYHQFDEAFAALLAQHVATGGAGLRVLTPPTLSPTFIRLRAAVLARLPAARFHVWEPVNDSNAREGAKLAFGAAVNTLPDYSRARVIVSLDADFLQTEPGMARHTRKFADGRRLHSPQDTMSRLYVVEPAMTTTGANADHRLRLPAGDVEAYLLALAGRLAGSPGVDLGELAGVVRGAAAPAGVSEKWLGVVAAELASHRGTGLLVAGTRQPPRVHALVHALNAALGNAGATVTYIPVTDVTEPEQVTDLQALVDAMGAGQVQTLVILGGNPAHDAPADMDFGTKLGAVAATVCLSVRRDETGARCTWHVPQAHYLETWGDLRSLDGSVVVQQPLIEPLFGGRSAIELLAVMAGEASVKGMDHVRETARGAVPAAMGIGAVFERAWRRALNRGVAAGTPEVGAVPPVRGSAVSAALGQRAAGQAIGQGNLEVTFAPDAKLHDGRHANNAWLAELPDPVSRITWDNAATMSAATARALGIDPAGGDLVRITKGGRSVEVVAWVLPGQADWSIGLTLGWGRTAAGRVGNGKGFDVYPLRTAQALWFTDGASVTRVGTRYPVSQTQDHHKMEGRPVAIESTLADYVMHPDFAEQRSPAPHSLPLWRGVNYEHGHQWGMSIDLNACTGCNACAIACQSENNVPVVGKDQVSRGREMHWLRVDRYFVSPRSQGDRDPLSDTDPLTAFQPLACVQCENAPCENVCPVAATTHSPEGLNDMAYNRCIGTRYCANNCPYKVRRFNYLNWHNDGVYQPEDPDVPETVRMAMNPQVSVRFRGVMEKCTYCVQRIQNGKIDAKRDGNRPLRDGEIRTACQQACPAGAIVFGDLHDPGSEVARLAREDRRYKLLSELGTQPRTSYLAKIRNPNPEMLG